jgi:very-short-patch-repair endonuclease/predicted transcriptional regulator
MTEEESYDLTRSARKLGQLYPILKDKRGNIIDGFHRQNADPDWATVTVESVDSDQKLELARLATNFCRRTLKEPEFQNKLKFLIGKCGMKPEEIAEQTGISERTIYRYIPQELKPKGEAISEGMKKQLTSVSSSSNIQDMVECSNCHMGKHPNEIKEIDGKPYCLKCAPFAKARPAENIPNGVRLEKPSETWAYRKAQMSPQHSKMEEAILQKLDEAGIRPVVTDRSFCLASTTPDFYFPTLNLAVYLDGPVHEGKEDRDEELTDLLEKRHQVRVCRIKYSAMSDKEQTRILQEIKERTKP